MISDHCIQNLAMSILGNVFSERVAKIPDNMSTLGSGFCEYKIRGGQSERVFGLWVVFRLKESLGHSLPKLLISFTENLYKKSNYLLY